MQNSLPIYDNILNKIPASCDFNINSEQRQKLIEDISNNLDAHELLFVMIRIHQIKNSNNVSDLPYQSRFLKTKKGYKFDLSNIPNKLVYILIEFFKIHNHSKNDI